MSTPTPPSWDELHEVANGQSGHFTTQQATEAGFSPQLLHKHVHGGNLERPTRGIYRIARFPPSEHEDLVVLWLWSGQEAIFSHETALQLHGLSDALPARVHMTLPTKTSRRKKWPEGSIVHFADLDAVDQQWLGPVPITSPARAVVEVAQAHGDATLVSQAIEEGIRRELFPFVEVAAAGQYVAQAQGYGTPTRPVTEQDRWQQRYILSYSGTCTTAPPSDWPTVAQELGRKLGACLHVAQYFPSRTMSLEFAWHADHRPNKRDARALHKTLTKSFSWA